MIRNSHFKSTALFMIRNKLKAVQDTFSSVTDIELQKILEIIIL